MMLRHLLVLSCLLGFMLTACDSDSGSSEEEPKEPTINLTDLRQEIATQISNHNILPAYSDLSDHVQVLSKAAESFINTPDNSSLEILRSALKKAWLSWQTAAPFQLGPTETNAIRSAINTYPVNAGKIESNLMNGGYILSSISNRDAIGFAAIDYLINNRDKTVDDIIDDFVQSSERVQYLIDVTSEIEKVVTKTSQDWSNGEFIESFISTQSAGTDVGSAFGLLVNAFDLHFERFLRDGKVAIPAGVRSAGVPRPKSVEVYHGGHSGDLLVKSLQTYLDIFRGAGFESSQDQSLFDYLEEIDQKELGDEIDMVLVESINMAKALNNDFTAQIEESNEAMVNMFLTLQRFVTLLKSDMASVMGITITVQDNDGD